jgi:hypothetical protein
MTNVGQQIEQQWQQVRSAPETIAAVKTIDTKVFNQQYAQCREYLTTYINFDSYKNSLQALKSRQSNLQDDTEADFAERFDQGLKAYRSFASSANAIAKLFAAGGMESVLSGNVKKLCWQLPQNQNYPQFTGMLRTMGISDTQITQYAAALQAADWDLFRAVGADGTFAGTVKLASDQVPLLENLRSAVKQHGVPLIEGSGGSVLPTVTALGVIVGLGVVCVASGFCAVSF